MFNIYFIIYYSKSFLDEECIRRNCFYLMLGSWHQEIDMRNQLWGKTEFIRTQIDLFIEEIACTMKSDIGLLFSVNCDFFFYLFFFILTFWFEFQLSNFNMVLPCRD